MTSYPRQQDIAFQANLHADPNPTPAFANEGPRKRMLEVGLGFGIFTQFLPRTGAKVTAIDINPDFIMPPEERKAGADSDHGDPAKRIVWMRLWQFQRLIPFLVTGLANSIVGYSTIFFCLFVGMSGIISNVIGFAFGLTCSFVLNRGYVFGVRGAVSSSEVARFLCVFFIAYSVNLCVLLLIQPLLGDASVLAQVIAVGAYSVVFYALTGRFVFRRRP